MHTCMLRNRKSFSSGFPCVMRKNVSPNFFLLSLLLLFVRGSILAHIPIFTWLFSQIYDKRRVNESCSARKGVQNVDASNGKKFDKSRSIFVITKCEQHANQMPCNMFSLNQHRKHRLKIKVSRRKKRQPNMRLIGINVSQDGCKFFSTLKQLTFVYCASGRILRAKSSKCVKIGCCLLTCCCLLLSIHSHIRSFE